VCLLVSFAGAESKISSS